MKASIKSDIKIIEGDKLFDLLFSAENRRCDRGMFYSKAWIRVLSEAYDYPIMAAVHHESEEFLLYTLAENNLGKKLVSLPFSDYVQYENTQVPYQIEILKYLEKMYPDYRFLIKTNLDSTDLAGFIRKESSVYHKIIIDENQQISEVQSRNFIRNTRKSIKRGVHVKMEDSIKALDAFYEMNARYRIERFHKVPQPYEFFLKIYDHFISSGNGFILNAKLGSTTIASLLILIHKKDLYYKFGCSRSEYMDYRPNNLLFSNLIEYAINNKFQSIDLGLSGRGEEYSGLRHFKESMGGIEFPITNFEKNAQQYPLTSAAKFKKLIDQTSEDILEEKDLGKIKELSSFVYPYFI